MQLQSNMGGRLHWPVLLTSNGGADLMPLREAEQAITPLEAVAATGDCYSHHLLRLVYGDGDAAVLLNVPELMRRHGGSAGEGAGAGGSGSGRLLVAGRAARGAGETDVSWHPQQPGSTHIAAAPTIVVPGRAGRLPDVRMTEAAGSGGGGGGAGGSTAGGGADRSRREAAAPGGHSGDGAHARHWWQQPNGAAGATDTARRPPLEAEVKFDARVESALGLTFRAAAGAEPDAEVLRCVARLLLQAPPPHTLTFPYLGLKVGLGIHRCRRSASAARARWGRQERRFRISHSSFDPAARYHPHAGCTAAGAAMPGAATHVLPEARRVCLRAGGTRGGAFAGGCGR